LDFLIITCATCDQPTISFYKRETLEFVQSFDLPSLSFYPGTFYTISANNDVDW